MRFYGLALIASAVVLGACGGGDKNASTDTTAAATPAPATSAPATGAAATPAAGAVAPAPATGKTWEVKMYGDATGYKFVPADLTIKEGDAVNFTVVDGQPHNIAFDPSTIPAAGKAQLEANMPTPMSELNSPMLLNAGDHYTISFANVAPGTYPYHCTPHLAMNMKGTITVQ